MNAVCFARARGAPLIVSLTVVWAHLPGFSEAALGALTTRLFDRMGKWLRRRGVTLHAVWTRERGPQKGHHLHALLNVPVPLVPDLERYLNRAFGAAPGAVQFGMGRFGLRTAQMQMGFLRYACKTLDHRAFVYAGFDAVNVADAIGIQSGGTDGTIRVKRAGWTENIGPTARRRAGWREQRHLDEIAFALHPPGKPRTGADTLEQRRAV